MLPIKLIQSKLITARLFATIVILLSFIYSYGQDVLEKKDPILTINYFNLNNNYLFARLSAKYKVEKTFFPMENLVIKLFLKEATTDNLIGSVTTNFKGEGRIVFTPNLKNNLDSISTFDLIAETDSSTDFNTATATATIENVMVELQTEEIDSTKLIRAFVYKKGDKEKTPIEKIELNFYVTRTFGMIPLSAENLSTDEKGMAEIEYTEVMPGDSSGMLTMAVKLSDIDLYGDVIILKETTWGKKVNLDHGGSVLAALWASRANVPLWLLILSNSIIGAVWGTILYLIFQLFKIRKLGNA